MTRKVAESLCEVIGEFEQTNGAVDEDGGSFFRVKVVADISLPLCRGRTITPPNGSKNWVKFKYERLPSLCYWCGHLDHDDRDCDLWIQSNGTLTSEHQQFGPNLRAPPYRSTGRDVIYVPGYYKERKRSSQVQRRVEMEARVEARPDAATVPPVVPVPDMVMEGAEEGMNSETASELIARVQAVMEDVTEVIQRETNEGPDQRAGIKVQSRHDIFVQASKD